MFLDDKEPMIRDSPNVDLSRFPRCLAPFAAEPVGCMPLASRFLLFTTFLRFRWMYSRAGAFGEAAAMKGDEAVSTCQSDARLDL